MTHFQPHCFKRSATLALWLSIALFLLLSTHIAQAKTIAITNATVYTMTEQGMLSAATVIIKDDIITAITLEKLSAEDIKADAVIDAKGRILTPGFIGSINALGLVEVSAVARTQDSGDKKADITFDSSLAFNPKSSLIAYTRKGGITTNISVPDQSENLFAGQSFVVNLSGSFDSIMVKENAVMIYLGAQSKGSRAQKLQALDYLFADLQEKLSKNAAQESTSANSLKRDEKVLASLLAGEKPLLAHADRATDLLALLALKQKYQLDLVLVSAADAVVVAEQIAQANVPVITSAINNLPNSFDALHSRLSNVATLVKAGVKVAFAPKGDTHNLNQLRFDAGIAVANGLSYSDALFALTANVADIFKLNSGRIALGKPADLVLWSADPLELSSKVEMMWINGKAISTQSRQDALRNRYTQPSELPKAYLK